MSIPTRRSSFYTRISCFLQNATNNESSSFAQTMLTVTVNAPIWLCRILIDIGTQPLPEQEPHIRATSHPAALPGYWIAPQVASVNDFHRWEVNSDDFDILLIYCHGGAFAIGHALMYTSYFYRLTTTHKLRVRIYTLEFELPTSNRHLSRYPYQHHKLFTAYNKLLEWKIPPSKIVIGGDSSGAFNTLKCFEKLMSENIPSPGGIILNSPLLDLWIPKNYKEEIAKLGADNSLRANRDVDFVGPRFLKNGLDLYKPPFEAAPAQKGTKWYADNLPPTFLAYGTGEVLLDTCRGFENGLKEGKVDVTTCIGLNETHNWNVLARKYAKDKNAWENSSEVLIAWMERISRMGMS